MASANEQAATSERAQFQAQLDAYPRIQQLQLGTVQTIADNLNNGYTASANNLIGSAMAQRANIDAMAGNVATQAGNVAGQAGNVAGIAPQIGQQAANVSGLGTGLAAFGSDQLARSGPNSLEQDLYNQTAGDLALGSRLNAEEERAASQAARGAFSARGLGVGSGAASAELLNRYQFGQSRLAQRQGAALNANNSITQNVIARQGVGLGALGQAGALYSNAGNLLGAQANVYGQAGGLYGQAGGLFGNAGSLYNQSAQLGLAGANAYLAADPYQRALGTGVQLGSGILGQTGQMIGNAYNSATQMAGNVASFNTNMAASMYNSALNNNAALGAASTGMLGQLGGAGIGALGSIGGSAIMGKMMAGGAVAL
jgi:hypothetical protein